MLININKGSVIFQGIDPVFALKDITVSVNRGEWINILGPSGSGKTTLLNVIGGIVRLGNGTISIDNKELTSITDEELQEYRRNKVGYIFQDYRLFDQFTVLENVMVPQWPYQNKRELEIAARNILKQLQMDRRLDSLPNELSGGEKQRTAIARAILHQPDIILCDEPTGNLDKDNRDNILQILRSLNEKGLTVLLVTHDLEVINPKGRTFIIRDGNLQEMNGK
ncbi:hypothetical protein G3A_16270 [Bacillus sp. 17376]|uniref:ABC transporter n=1 Tax=Mesobacillus boroniphilus JCM 21738 TaxID=1294265 RepID=W4RUH6_9BACI|nr:ABC transporter ATP-binding protein [Mesobacillus boroniphilus]ESU31523.1 hypothetical protein G3A_16270 [Bacillus sp. 17376]GAE47936.1 ABC transporter [Mesobacillus boroniphilus JCM 21738]